MPTKTTNTVGHAGWSPDFGKDVLKSSLDMLRSAVPPDGQFNGKIVMVKEGEMIVDKVSGNSYVTEKTCEEMKKTFPRVEANNAGI